MLITISMNVDSIVTIEFHFDPKFFPKCVKAVEVGVERLFTQFLLSAHSLPNSVWAWGSHSIGMNTNVLSVFKFYDLIKKIGRYSNCWRRIVGMLMTAIKSHFRLRQILKIHTSLWLLRAKV